MLDIVNHLQPYLEAIYFLSGAGLLVGVTVAFRQLFVIKRDIQIRNQRAAMEKAIEACDSFLTVYIPLINAFFHWKEKAQVGSYGGPVGDFSSDSIPEQERENALKRFEPAEWAPAMNRLESISSYFVTGVADEATGFGIIGRSFCDNVESEYDLISMSRTEGTLPYWSNTVQLYQLWRPRLKKGELESEQDDISSKLSSLQTERLRPFGTEE